MIDFTMKDVLILFWELLQTKENELMCGDFLAINDDMRLIQLGKAWVLHTLAEGEEDEE
jgi:hypothetical protein